MLREHRQIKRWLCCLTAILLFLNLCTSSTRLSATEASVELEQLSEELDTLCAEISDLDSTLAQLEADLAVAEENKAIQYQAMKERIQFLYENGTASFMEMLLASKSLAEFVNRVEFISTVSSYDRNMLLALQTIENELIAKQTELQDTQAILLGKKADLEETKYQLEQQVAAEEYAAYQASLEAAKAAVTTVSVSLASSEQSQGQQQVEASEETVAPEATSWQTFNVSAYCSCSICCGSYSDGITSSGVVATPGVTIAADSSYAYGTKIYLEGLGTYIVQDRGGAIKGNKIDIYFSSHSAALAFGRHQVRGYVVS